MSSRKGKFGSGTDEEVPYGVGQDTTEVERDLKQHFKDSLKDNSPNIREYFEKLEREENLKKEITENGDTQYLFGFGDEGKLK